MEIYGRNGDSYLLAEGCFLHRAAVRTPRRYRGKLPVCLAESEGLQAEALGLGEPTAFRRWQV